MSTASFQDVQASLVQLRRDAEERDAQRQATALHVPYVDIRKTPVALDALKLIPEDTARAASCAAVELSGHAVALAATNPTTPEVAAIVRDLESKHYVVKRFTASHTGIDEAWVLYQFVPKPKQDITGELGIDASRITTTPGLGAFKQVADELQATDYLATSTTQLFERIISAALATKTSDVHLESHEQAAVIRFRIDGLLHEVTATVPLKTYSSIVARIKLLAGLKINVRSEPQDGRFTIALTGGKQIEVRVSVIPSEFGEIVVMRILDPDGLAVHLNELGLRPDDEAFIRTELTKPNGLILNTGPTGSGKTTTLYSFLRHVVDPEIKIITIEDPIEYHLAGVEQTQVDPDGGYTFANGLRSMLRQDPDVILVGEIRDGETADIAMQAALTGHLVFSTLHTNSALGAIPRLVDLGVRPATIGPALSLVIAQRLVRRLCDSCKKPAPLSVEQQTTVATILNALPARVPTQPYRDTLTVRGVFVAGSCEVCSGFGYRGRIAIFEFLQIDGPLQELILQSPSEVVLRRAAEEQGMVTMQQDGILKAIDGITTLDEVISVTGPLVLPRT